MQHLALQSRYGAELDQSIGVELRRHWSRGACLGQRLLQLLLGLLDFLHEQRGATQAIVNLGNQQIAPTFCCR